MQGGKKVKVPTFLVPATQKVCGLHCDVWCFCGFQCSASTRIDRSSVHNVIQVWMDVYSLPVPGSGGKTCSQIFEEAGCDTPASPSCGACLGGPRDTYARMNEPLVCVSTTNRNFPGRMGHKEGQVYLASPYTAAASALTGFVTDPRDFLQ
nr:3-isopropylmalate dehydratase large subunit, chloroplastic [Ipomoea batatas]